MATAAIADDPRVRRQAEAFHRAGWKVVAVGLPGAKSPPPEWSVLTRDDVVSVAVREPTALAAPSVKGMQTRPKSWMRQILLRKFRIARSPLFATEVERPNVDSRAKKHIGRALSLLGRLRYGLRLLAIRIRPELAEKVYWRWSQNIHDIYACGRRVDAAVWLANDWNMLPVAARLAREKRGIYGYDTHEFAVEEYAENRTWRLVHRPMVGAIERQFIGGAAVVSAVSSGIAERLDALYRLPRPTLTIRNTTDFEEVAFRRTRRDRIEVLYHGIVVPNRGIEAAVESVALWRPEFSLTIRGPENPAFSPILRDRIAALGLEKRVRLVPPVPMTALVREASSFDVGFFALPGHSRHNEFALPNKFFEYVMAGLALCTTDLPEMSRLIRQYDLGVTIAAAEPEAMAAAVNALDPDRIDRFKLNALAAARELCWERESQRLVGAYSAAVAQACGRHL
jgi:glycosyltransferase involved in cell wall biosynthesis